jgi:prepilin-type N-terminal cleavage/methylation domain-containing protein
MPSFSPRGSTLIEMLVVLALLAVFGSLTAPSWRDQTSRVRTRSALNHLASDVARARGLAIHGGARLHVSFRPSRGCAVAYVIARAEGGAVLDSVSLADRSPGVCLSANVEQPMVINSRGMLVGSPRTVRARAGRHADSLTVSMAGRVYRWF